MTTHRRPARRPGLSLIEVLVALAIFLFSLVAIFGLIDFGSDRAAAAAMQAAGTRLAQSKLAEVEAGAVAVSTGGSGAFDEEPEWSWSVEPGAATVPNVYPVTVRAYRDYGGRHYEVRLSQMVFDPAQMGGATSAQPPSTGSTSGTTSGSSSGTTSGGSRP